MKGMEEWKHLDPNFSDDFGKLVVYFKKKDAKLGSKPKSNTTANEFFTETDREFIEIQKE